MSTLGRYTAYVEKAREMDLFVSSELNIPEEQSHRIIRSVFHALRKHLPYDESMQLVAQLPLIWKGIYVEGWRPLESAARIHSLDEWLDAIREEDQQLAAYDFGNHQKATKTFLAVWRAIEQKVSESELRHICNSLPKEIREPIMANSSQSVD